MTGVRLQCSDVWNRGGPSGAGALVHGGSFEETAEEDRRVEAAVGLGHGRHAGM